MFFTVTPVCDRYTEPSAIATLPESSGVRASPLTFTSPDNLPVTVAPFGRNALSNDRSVDGRNHRTLYAVVAHTHAEQGDIDRHVGNRSKGELSASNLPVDHETVEQEMALPDLEIRRRTRDIDAAPVRVCDTGATWT
jgi:hypothetical protein